LFSAARLFNEGNDPVVVVNLKGATELCLKEFPLEG